MKTGKIIRKMQSHCPVEEFKLGLAKSLRRFAFAGVVFSTVAAVLSMITIPMIYYYLQTVQSVLRDELEFCKIRSNDLWLSVSVIRVQQGLPVPIVERQRRQALLTLNPGENLGATNLFQAPSLTAPVVDAGAGGYFGIAYPQPAQQYGGGGGGESYGQPPPQDNYGPIQPPADNYGGGDYGGGQTTSITCTCQIGKAGKPGLSGKNGKDGKDGEPGKPGIDGKAPAAGSPAPAPKPACDCGNGTSAPAGPPGPKGPKGPPGDPGPDAPGPVSTPGPAGPPGPQGPPGRTVTDKGPPGDPGKINTDNVVPGPSGPPGGTGPAGPPGPAGTPGKTQPPAVAGQPGDPGFKGTPGTSPAPGPPGPKGTPATGTKCDHCPPPRTAPGY